MSIVTNSENVANIIKAGNMREIKSTVTNGKHLKSWRSREKIEHSGKVGKSWNDENNNQSIVTGCPRMQKQHVCSTTVDGCTKQCERTRETLGSNDRIQFKREDES